MGITCVEISRKGINKWEGGGEGEGKRIMEGKEEKRKEAIKKAKRKRTIV